MAFLEIVELSVRVGSLLLWIDVLVQPAQAANIAITFSLRASGDSRFPAIVGSTLMWTVGIGAPLAWPLAQAGAWPACGWAWPSTNGPARW